MRYKKQNDKGESQHAFSWKVPCHCCSSLDTTNKGKLHATAGLWSPRNIGFYLIRDEPPAEHLSLQMWAPNWKDGVGEVVSLNMQP